MPRIVQTSAELADAQPPFIVSDQIEAVAAKVIAEHEISFGWIPRDVRVVYLLKTGDKVAAEDTIDTIAKCVKAPALWSVLAEYDFAIWAKEAYWSIYPAKMREALIAHELSHIGMSDKGKPEIVPHSIEEFGQVVAWYGPWAGNVAHFGRQLVTYLRDGEELAQKIDEAMGSALEELDGTTIEAGGTIAHISTARGRTAKSKAKPRPSAEDQT